MNYNDFIDRLNRNSKIVIFKFPMILHLFIYLLFAVFLLMPICEIFPSWLIGGQCNLSFEQYKFSLLYVGRWMGLLFALLYFFLNLKHFFFMLGGVFLGKVPISILMFFLFFSFLYVLTWLNPSIFLHGFGMRSHFSVVLIVFLMTSLLSNGLVAFMWGIGYVKRNG